MLSTENLQEGKVCYNIQLKLEKMYGLSPGTKKTVRNKAGFDCIMENLWFTLLPIMIFDSIFNFNPPLIAN